MSKKNTRLVVVDAKSLSALPAASAKGSRKTGKQRRNKGKQQMSTTPAAFNAVYQMGTPTLRPMGNGDGRIVVNHREFLTTVGPGATTDFTCRKLEINPGLPITFPWLSGIARLYESYRFRALRFDYVPSVGTTTSGSVSLALDYDAFDDPPQSKADLMANHRAMRGTAWSPMSLSADTPDLNKFGTQRYTRQAELAPNLDIKTYDVCALFVAVDGSPNPNIGWGDIFVSYSVELMTPQSPIWINGENTPAAEIIGAASVSQSKPFGDNPVINSSLNFPIAVTSGRYINFIRAGKYIVEELIGGAVTGTVPPTWTRLVGTMVKTPVAAIFNGTGTNGNVTSEVEITSPNTLVDIQCNPGTTIGQYELRIAPWSI